LDAVRTSPDAFPVPDNSDRSALSGPMRSHPCGNDPRSVRCRQLRDRPIRPFSPAFAAQTRRPRLRSQPILWPVRFSPGTGPVPSRRSPQEGVSNTAAVSRPLRYGYVPRNARFRQGRSSAAWKFPVERTVGKPVRAGV